MNKHLRALLGDPEMAREFARNGLETILQRHTCTHRVDELLTIVNQLRKRFLPEAVSA
jgi:spore maturation protein CgeB